jgi:hypothetical protein
MSMLDCTYRVGDTIFVKVPTFGVRPVTIEAIGGEEGSPVFEFTLEGQDLSATQRAIVFNTETCSEYVISLVEQRRLSEAKEFLAQLDELVLQEPNPKMVLVSKARDYYAQEVAEEAEEDFLAELVPGDVDDSVVEEDQPTVTLPDGSVKGMGLNFGVTAAVVQEPTEAVAEPVAEPAAPVVVEAPAPKPEKVVKAKTTRTGKIVLIVDHNPKRGATGERFRKMMEAVEAGNDSVAWILANTPYNMDDLRWDINKNLVKVEG